MAKRVFLPGAYYHTYNRGVNRQRIFFSDRNKYFFLRRLQKYFTDGLAEIIAYCLMPNHYHLLVRVMTENFSHRVMQPFATSYTKAINKEQNRVGPLFQGRYKFVLVEKNAFLLHLTRYIHRNPVEAGLVEKPADWVFSSYRGYVRNMKRRFLKPAIVLEQFSSKRAYSDYVEGSEQNLDFISHLLLD